MRCIAIKKDGQRCESPSMIGKEYCFFHNPETRETRLDASKRGGIRPHWFDMTYYEILDGHIIDSSTDRCIICKGDDFDFTCYENHEFRDDFEDIKVYMDSHPGLYLLYPKSDLLFNQDVGIFGVYNTDKKIKHVKIKFLGLEPTEVDKGL